MVTGAVERALVNVLAGPLVGQQFVAFFATALKAPNRVSTNMVTAPIVQATLVNIFAGLAVGLQGEADGTAAAHPCHRVVTRAVAAAIVHRASLIVTIGEQLWGGLGLDTPLPYTSLSIAVQDKLHVARTLGPVIRLLADVLAAAVTIVTCQFAVLHVAGELESRSALAGNATLLRLSADVSAAVILVHTGGPLLCPVFGPLDAGVLVVTQEEALSAAALVTAHHVHTDLLTAAVPLRALVHIQTVVSVVSKPKAVVARAPVVSRDVDALVNAAPVVFGGALIHIFTVFAVSFVSRLADTFVGLEGVLANGVNAAVVNGLGALVHILSGFTS